MILKYLKDEYDMIVSNPPFKDGVAWFKAVPCKP